MYFRHYLYGDFGPESEPHSHPYVCEWRLYANTLNATGFVVDISLMKRIMDEVLTPLNEVLLNDLEEFHHQQTSVENVALWLLKQFWQELKKRIEPLSLVEYAEVRLYEDPDTWASVLLERKELE